MIIAVAYSREGEEQGGQGTLRAPFFILKQGYLLAYCDRVGAGLIPAEYYGN